MKVNMQNQMSRMRAVSSFDRAAIHTPRHTSQLASTARRNSCTGGMFILAATTFCTKALTAPKLSASSSPALTTITASSRLPARLPSHVHHQFASSSRQVALPVNTPSVRTRLLPVNSSEPANTTSVSAPPKHTPMTSRTTPGDSLDSEPPTVKIRKIAAPTYIPASIERTKWLTSERFCAASLAAAWSPRALMVSVYMGEGYFSYLKSR